MQASAQQEHFFNLHVSGVGYMSRIRWVKPNGRGRKGESFLACAISALRGSSDSPDYTYFDLRVSSEEAIYLVEKYQKDVEERRKVLVSFRVGDIYVRPYEREVRDQDGRPTGEKELAGLIKGRLILIHTIKIDGVLVYKRPASSNVPDSNTPLEGVPQESADGQAPADNAQSRPAPAGRAPAPAPAPAPSAPRRPAPQRYGDYNQPASQRYGTRSAGRYEYAE